MCPSSPWDILIPSIWTPPRSSPLWPLFRQGVGGIIILPIWKKRKKGDRRGRLFAIH